MTNEIILEAMASDLKRVALGLERGSFAMSKRFALEALKRKEEVNIKKIPDYIEKILIKSEQSLANLNNDRTAEDCLMYSTLLQNFSHNQARFNV